VVRRFHIQCFLDGALANPGTRPKLHGTIESAEPQDKVKVLAGTFPRVMQEARIQARKQRILVRILKWTGVGIGVLLLLAAAGAAYLHWFSPLDQAWVVKALEDHYKCDVQLKSFHSSLFPLIRVSGEGLVLRQLDTPNLPPLASIEKFSVTAYWLELLRHPRHFREVRLDGFILNVPPRRENGNPGSAPAPTAAPKKGKPGPHAFVLDHVVANGSIVNIISSKPGKLPTVLEIKKLAMQSAGVGPQMRFKATLINPHPVGLIESNGDFGPWNADDPSLTPVKGKYTFRHADLSTIHGLKGILSSDGNYDGVLSSINVHGETDTPDFGLTRSGTPVHLRTKFEAVVDGVNGDTALEPVTAQLLSSTIVARGSVVKRNGKVHGRNVFLNVTAQPARLQDLLRLVEKSSNPSMTGNVRIQAKLDIPPGEEDVDRRLKLDGDFNIESAQFADPDTESKIRSISRIGLGKHSDDAVTSAPVNMSGHLVLANGTAKFTRLEFSVPGAAIKLQGTYGLDNESLNFEGTAAMQATVSQMTTGIKSVLLKAIDPLLSKDGHGTVVPIQITGTRANPSFHIEIGKILQRIH
jgi:hypothetical protein